METIHKAGTHFLHPGAIFTDRNEYHITTVLGSCIAVCLWDPMLKTGGMNHYMLPLWNGEGLASPRYGNIAIQKLIEKMLRLGSKKQNLKAKIFGGAAVLNSSSSLLSVGARNILVAEDLLLQEKIPIVSQDVGGELGRKIQFNTTTGGILLKKIAKSGQK